MEVTCIGLTNKQHLTDASDVAPITQKDIPPFPQDKANSDYFYLLVIQVRPSGSTNDVFIKIYEQSEMIFHTDEVEYNFISKQLQTLSHFMPIKKSNLQWLTTDFWSDVIHIDFHNLTETLRYCAQYALLIGIQFTSPEYQGYWSFPVIKKDGNYYKAIGLYTVDEPVDSFNDIKEGTFKIH